MAALLKNENALLEHYSLQIILALIMLEINVNIINESMFL